MAIAGSYFYLELLGGCKKALEILLRHLGLPEIHEAENELQGLVLDPFEVNQRVLVGIVNQDLLQTNHNSVFRSRDLSRPIRDEFYLEEWTASTENHLV